MSTTQPTSKKGLFLKLKPAQQLETIYDTLEDILVRLREHSSLLQKIYSQIQEVDFSDSDLDASGDSEVESEHPIQDKPPMVEVRKKRKVEEGVSKTPLSKTQTIFQHPENQTQEMEF